MQLSQSEFACMWNLWWVSQQQLDCKSFVEALARIKTAKCTYRTFVKSSPIDSRESNVPTRRSGIWNCCDIQPRGRRQKVSSVHNSSHPRKITQEATAEQNQRMKRKKKWKQNQAPKWNYCCNEASCTLLTDIWWNAPCKSGYRRRCSRRSGKDCSMLRSRIVHSTKAMIPGYTSKLPLHAFSLSLSFEFFLKIPLLLTRNFRFVSCAKKRNNFEFSSASFQAHYLDLFLREEKGRRSNFLRPLVVPSTLLWSFLQTRSVLPLRSYLLCSFCFLVESANWPLVPLGSSLLILALIVTIGPCATNRPNNKKLWKSHKASSSSTIIMEFFH